MGLLVTPGQLLMRSEFYHQFGSMLSAGMPIRQCLETLRKSPPHRSLSKPVHETLLRIEQGYTYTESLASGDRSVPSFDLALIGAGEHSGRLDQCLKLLADYYRTRAELLRQIAAQCAYPVVVIHVGILLAPIQDLVLRGDIAGYLVAVLTRLGPIYLFVIGLMYACQGPKGETWRTVLESVGDAVPFLGSARRNLALARLAMALEALLSAGVPILQCWPLASLASGSPRLNRAALQWMPMAENLGHPPGEILQSRKEYPEMFANLYATGEKSGTLDDTLKRLEHHFREEGVRGMKQVAAWFPRLIYFGVCGWVAFRVVSFYSAYFKQLSDVMGK